MPAVSILPSSPLPGRPGPNSQINGTGQGHSRDVMSVAEIKAGVNSLVKQQTRGASAQSLLKTAKSQAIQGGLREKEGDLQGALKAFWMAAQLTQAVLSSAEWKSESDRKGPVWKDFVEYQQQYGNELIPRTMRLEARLTELERNRSSPNDGESDDGPISKSGASIADRMRSLQDAGLSLQTTKRFSRELASHPPLAVTRVSSQAASPSPMTSPVVTSPPSTQVQFNFNAPQLSSNLTESSAHSFVSPSSFGPPSPTSSASSSPRLRDINLTEFNKAFPLIDELDEMADPQAPSIPLFLQLPSVPATEPGLHAPAPAIRSPRPLPSPPVVSRFPSLPLDLDPGQRPASTPIPPTLSAIPSGPPSPVPAPVAPQVPNGITPVTSYRHPRSPRLPPKPSNLSVSSGAVELLELDKTNAIDVRKLHECMNKPGVKVLLLDIRVREQFDAEHIRGDAVVCLEPQVLLRDGMTGEQLEDSLSVAPQHESVLFRNRDKFDLVVMYDHDSHSFGPAISPMSAAMRIIYEQAFRRILKRNPVVVVGGLDAWRNTYPDEVVSEPDSGGNAVASSSARTERPHLSPSPTSSSTADASSSFFNGSVNGVYVNGTGMASDASDIPSHEIWMPTRPRSGTDASSTSSAYDGNNSQEQMWSRSPHVMNQIPEYTSPPAEVDGDITGPEPPKKLTRKPALSRPPSSTSPPFQSRSPYDTSSVHYSIGSQLSLQHTGPSSIQYPHFSRHSSSTFGNSLGGYSSPGGMVSLPPQASINPSPLARRRSDYIDQSEQAVSTFASRPSIDYPDLSARHVVRPPPAAASPALERQDNRPRLPSHGHGHANTFYLNGSPTPPTIQSDYPVVYWPDMQIATSGLKNLGNTCYMNSTIQCLSATVPFSRFFTDGRWKSAVNMVNPLGSKGQLTMAFANILHDMRHEEPATVSPYTFRRSLCTYAKQFAGSEQHDSQEFLSFLLDGLHEDLNRVLNRPLTDVSPEREAELETLQQQIASEQEWALYRMRNDSIVVDFFQGQFRNRMECLTCRKTSTTYNTFMYLSLPLPSSKSSSRPTLRHCLDAFVQEEVMDKSDAWHCPNCKTLRKATKHLSLSRLPPILLIHLKRFSFKGPFTDKLETFVEFPVAGLDLTNYMPSPLPPGDRKSSAPVSLDDPRTQLPPYRYDLYGVTNHFGTLSSGHYTAFIKSRGNWLYCDDSRIATADSKEVVGKPAYVLFYKRTKL